MSITMIYHPTWSKNNGVREVLSGLEFSERNLVETMLKEEEILRIAQSLQVKVHELLRSGSPVYKERKEELLDMSEEELARVIANEPTLIKRPIIKTEKGYVVGLNAEKIQALIKK